MVASTLTFLAKTYTSKSTSSSSKLFQYLTTSICAIASLAYLVMALGRSDITSGQELHSSGKRALLWVRYAGEGAPRSGFALWLHRVG